MVHYDVKRLMARNLDIARATQPKSMHTNKIDRGVLAVIAGSKDYHGAPAMTSSSAQSVLAALRVGAGYVVAYIPEAVAPIVREQSPAIVVRTLGKGNIIFNGAVKGAVEKSNAIVIGMGIGLDQHTKNETARILDLCFSLHRKVVIDAGAIRSMPYTRKRPDLNAVLTPQDSEFEFLYGVDMSKKGIGERIDGAVKLSRRLGAVILFKGNETIITDGKKIRVVKSRSAALATMGSGDVLSGIIGGYAATGASTYDAAVAGAYLHSRIGEMLFRKMGNHIISTDVVESIPSVLKRFDKVYR